jgi:hypothetical protein
MRTTNKLKLAGLIFAGLMASAASAQQAAPGPMSFFITSTGSGDGANLGGLEGADAICQARAEAAGSTLVWRAYLSTQGEGAVNARDRIGAGPWFNARGAQIAANLDQLHGPDVRLGFVNALDERGRFIPGSGYFPNRHDIITGSTLDGMAYPAGDDMTCGNYTSNGDLPAKVRLGHHDFANWNSTHDSRGCGQAALVSTGGDGLFYCFAGGQ